MVAAVHGMAFRGSNQHVPSTFNNSVGSNGDNECVACQLIYSGVVGTVKIQNATVAELEKVSKEVCDLRISVNKNGRVINTNLIKSSGNIRFDNSALKAVERVETFNFFDRIPMNIYSSNFKNIVITFNPS